MHRQTDEHTAKHTAASLPILLAVVQQPKLSALATLICTLEADKGVGGQILREHKLALLLMATRRAVWALLEKKPGHFAQEALCLWQQGGIPEHHAGLSPAAPRAGISAKGQDTGGETCGGSFLFSHKDKATITSGRSQSPTCSQLENGGNHWRMLQYNPPLSTISFPSTVLAARTATCSPSQLPSPHFFPDCGLTCQRHCREGEEGMAAASALTGKAA